MSINHTDEFIDYLYNLSSSGFSSSIIHHAKRCLLDYLGVTYAGAQMLEEKGNKLLNFLGERHGETHVIGFDRKTSIENAVFVNGLSAHVTELDDGIRFGVIHPGAPIVSTLLSIAEKEQAHGSDLLAGVITGYEAAIRLSLSIQPSHYNLGYHPTGTCGSIGAAIGVATMLRFTKNEMKKAFSTAVISASGTLKVLDEGSELKPFNAGRAALVGLLSAAIGKAGFDGPDDALSGDTGFFAMMAEQYDHSMLLNEESNPPYIEKVYFKPYAACRHAHSAIEAALKIKTANEIKPGDIKSIIISTYQGVFGKHDHTVIHGVSSARMSIPFSVALAIVFGKLGIGEFTQETISNPEVVSLLSKVDIYPDAELTSLIPDRRPALVEIETYDGNCFSERVDLPKGEPENPLSDEELEQKFISLAKYGNKSQEDIHKIIQIVWNLENELPDLYQLL